MFSSSFISLSHCNLYFVSPLESCSYCRDTSSGRVFIDPIKLQFSTTLSLYSSFPDFLFWEVTHWPNCILRGLFMIRVANFIFLLLFHLQNIISHLFFFFYEITFSLSSLSPSQVNSLLRFREKRTMAPLFFIYSQMLLSLRRCTHINVMYAQREWWQ